MSTISWNGTATVPRLKSEAMPGDHLPAVAARRTVIGDAFATPSRTDRESS